MSVPEKIAFKNKLKEFCQHTIEQRMAAAQNMIQHAQEAANNEEKSSAGDKYETSRAMGHLQKDMYARQLAQCIKELANLHSVYTGALYQQAGPGAAIETAVSLFFIAAGLGKHTVDGQTILFLSPFAPLAGILQNKKQGDSFVFNSGIVLITAVY